MANTIFLPFYYSRNGLKLVTIETFGEPARYFRSWDSQFLRNFWANTSYYGFETTAVRDGGEIVLNERESWKISYCIVQTSNHHYIRDVTAFKIVDVNSIDDVLNGNFPAELRLAILQVINTELAEAA